MTSQLGQAPAPWQRSWFYRAPGETGTLIWMVLIHLFTVVGLIVLPLPSWQAFTVAAALYALGALGTTVAYHRILAHRTATLNPVVERILIFFGIFNGSGDPLTWVANHRYHHANSDKDDDVSSPRHGFWWAHLRWLWQAEQNSPERYCPDVLRAGHQVWKKLQAPILAVSLFGGLVLLAFMDWRSALAAWLWIGPVRLVAALHVQCSVNSLCHLGPIDADHGSGLNVWWMTPLHMGQGENWHANHHRAPNSARFGQKWWQLDAGWWFIATMDRLGAARVKATARTRSS
jgi:fatty-acid desaturase